MTNSSTSSRTVFETERARASTTFNGTFLTIGTALTRNPVILIIDNQSDVAVPISVDGVNVWKTFSAGQAIVLDLRGNTGNAETFAPGIGTQFYTNATVGTSGSIRISILSAR